MTIRIGVIGYGYWGPILLRNLVASLDFEVVAVADRSADARARIKKTMPDVRLFDDAADVLNLADVEAVVVATPVATHFPIARQALINGKHVLVEKPLTDSVSEAEELVHLAARVNRVLMVDHTFLFTGAVQKIKQTLDSGHLGRLCYFDSMRVNLGLFQTDVNCLWDLAPHDLSIIDYLTNDAVVGIDVTGYCHVNPRLPDMVYMTLHYASNAVAHFNLSWMSPMKMRRFAIGGTKQMLIWDDLDQDQKIRIYDSGIEFRSEEERTNIIPDYRVGDIYSPRIERKEALAGVVEHFAAVIRGTQASIMSGEKGLKVVRILEEAQAQLDKSLTEIAARRKAAT